MTAAAAILREAVGDEHKAFFDEGFSRHAVAQTGMDGANGAAQAFVIRDDAGTLRAGVVARIFWGQLHVKNVLCDETARGKGYAAQLMHEAHDYGRAQGCGFAFVETMNFQAEGFYSKLGYVTEFVRPGYAAGTSFIYMKKELKDSAYA